MQNRRLLQYLSKNEIPSSAKEPSVGDTFNVLYIPIIKYNSSRDRENSIGAIYSGSAKPIYYYWLTEENKNYFNASSKYGVTFYNNPSDTNGTYALCHIWITNCNFSTSGSSVNNSGFSLAPRWTNGGARVNIGFNGYVNFVFDTPLKVVGVGYSNPDYPIYIDTE